MPDALAERHARRIIAAARRYTIDDNPWRSLPDADLIVPLLVADAHAAADLFEYLVDTRGVEGIDVFVSLIHLRAALAPRSMEQPPHTCRSCDPAAPTTVDSQDRAVELTQEAYTAALLARNLSV